MFEDARTVKALKDRGYIAEYKDGWYYVRVDAFLKAITYFRDHYTGAVEQHADELTQKFYANSEKLHNS